MNVLRKQMADGPKLLHFWLSLIEARAGEGPVVHVGLRESGLHRAAHNAVNVSYRTRRRDSANVELVAGNGIGDHAAHGIVGSPCAAGPDAEELGLSID